MVGSGHGTKVHRCLRQSGQRGISTPWHDPTFAVAILRHPFTVDCACKNGGTRFGPGIYLAESSTKADEYARDDAGGEFDGLYALSV